MLNIGVPSSHVMHIREKFMNYLESMNYCDNVYAVTHQPLSVQMISRNSEFKGNSKLNVSSVSKYICCMFKELCFISQGINASFTF